MTEPEIETALATMDRVVVDSVRWRILYRERTTGDFWEISYPHSEMHGGGPRELAPISHEDAVAHYPGVQISN